MNFLYDRAAALVRTIYDFRLDGPPVLDCAQSFPNAARFAASWEDLRDEALAIAARVEQVPRFHEIMREQEEISANDGRDWRMHIMKAYGVEAPANMARCPALKRVIEDMPEVLSASISFLAPRKHIPPHRGPFRGVLRFYLVLAMPKLADGRPAAVLKVDHAEHRLREGEYLLWDDTYVHEVLNESDEMRAVLLLDVWRPGMPFDMRILSRALIRLVRAAIAVRGFA